MNKITEQIEEIVELLTILNKLNDLIPDTHLYAPFYNRVLTHTEKKIEQLLAEHSKEFVTEDEET